MLDIEKTKEQLISELQGLRASLSSSVQQGETSLDDHHISRNEGRSKYIEEIEDLYNNAPCGYHSLAPNGVFIRINDTELKWLGYTREEMIGRMNFADILTEESLITFKENFPTFKARGWIKDLEFDLVKKDGSLMSVLLSATAVLGSDGNYLMSRSTLFDITHRKHLESELKRHHDYLEQLVEEKTRELSKSETNYRELWEKAPVMMVSLNSNAQIDYASDRFCEELGYGREEILGKSPFEFQTEESARFALQTIFPKFLQTGFVVDAPLQFVRKNGEIIDVLLNVTAERGEDGSIIRSRSVFTDVTVLKRTQIDLQETVDNLEEAQRVARLGNWSLNVLTGDLEWSDQLYRIFEIDRQDFENKYESFWKLVHPEDRELVLETNRLAREQGKAFELDYRIISHDVHERIIHEIGYASQDAAGNVIRLFGTAQDVTEIRRSQDERRMAEERLDLAQEAANAGSWEWDTVSGKIRWSEGLWKLLGYEPSSINPTYEKWLDSVHPDHREDVARVTNEAISKLANLAVQWRANDSEDSERWLMSRGKPIIDGAGRIKTYLGVVIDITDRILAQKELEHSRNVLRLFVDHSPVALAMFDREMRYLDASPRWIRDYGLTGIDIIGKSHYEIFPEIPDRWMDAHRRSLRGEIVKSEEDRFERVDGSIRWLRSEIRPWFTGDGNIGGIVIFTEDITDRKVAEEELHLNELYLRSIVDAITEPVFLMRTDGIILTANQAVARMLGVGESDLAGKCVYDYLPPDVLERRRSWVKQVAQTGVPLKMEDVHDEFQVYHSIYPVFNERGKVDKLAIYATDITDRVKMQKAVVEGEQRYRMIVEMANEGIWTLDQDLKVTFVNQRLARMLGYSIDEMLGMPFYSLIFNEDLADHNRRMELRQQGKPESYERRLKRKDGSLVWTIVNATPIMDRDGKFLGSFAMLTDITDRKKAEEGLRKNEQRLRMALEAARAGTWETDLQTNQSYWSEELFELYGLDPLVCRPSYDSWLQSIHPDDRSRIERSVQDAISTLSDTNMEWRVNLPGGEERWMLSRGRPFFDENDKATSYSGVVVDITERKRSEIEIQRSNELLDSILNNIPVMVSYMDSDGKYQYVNRSWQQTLGWSMEEATTRDLLPELSPDPNSKSHFRKHVIDSMTKSSLDWDDYDVITRDGRIIRTSWFSVPVASNNYVRLGLDITDRLKAEQTRKLLASVVENAAESIVITDANGIINYVNPAFEKNTGYCSEESLGRNPRFLKSGEQDKKSYEDLWKTILEGGTWYGTLINRRKDGSLIQEEATIFPIKVEPGNSTNFVAIKRDITKESSLQRQLIQAQKLEAIGTLAGGIAHDFNNIIFGITGYTDLAMQDLPTDSRAYINLQRVMAAAERSAEMVKQILAFSRQGEDEKAILDLSPLIKEGIKFLRGAIPATTKINQKIGSKLGKVMVDPTQMHQVLMNLCVNASQALMDNVGAITVELTEESLPLSFTETVPPLQPGKHLRLSVTDTADGIPGEILERIFDPYFTTKKAGKGTGLGLSVVHGIVQKHGGAITVNTELGKGSTFNVFLPVVQQEGPSAEKDLGPKSVPGGKERIMIVDDDDSLLEMYAAQLKRLGYSVNCFNRPTEALKAFKDAKDKFELVITDFNMPGMTGLEFAREVCSIRPGMPVILCSGFSERFTETTIDRAGVRRVLCKPVGRSDIAVAVRQTLDDEPLNS